MPHHDAVAHGNDNRLAGTRRVALRIEAGVFSVLLLALLWLAPASAAVVQRSQQPVFATAGTLQTWCLGRGAVRASCIGYLAGVVDGLRGAAGDRADRPCLPPRLAGEQVRLLFLNHLHRNPQAATRVGAEQVRLALAAAFPCSPPPAPAPGRDPGAERISRLPPAAPASRSRCAKVAAGARVEPIDRFRRPT